MRILAVDLPPSPEVNLGPIKMDKLGPIVVIAGRNGAGKTRLMNRLKNWSYEGRAHLLKSQEAYRRQLAQEQEPHAQQHDLRRLKEYEERLISRDRVTLDIDQKPQIVPFVPGHGQIADPSHQTKHSVIQLAQAVSNPGITHLAQGTFCLVQALQDRNWEATHPESRISKEEAERVKSDYHRMEAIIKKFLNTGITRSVNGEAQLFDLPLGQAALSDGQKIILQLCAAIFAQGTGLSDFILFMDVPETHLHPAALLDLVAELQSRLGSGQLWIATHSIPLLANVDPSAIWWMDNATITRAGKTPEIVLSGLLGDEVRRDRLANFLDLPSALASNSFAAECLLPPGTTPFKENDPQASQIRSILEKMHKGEGSLRILDFGAGKGRLASELASLWTPEQRNKLDYVAYDPSKKDGEACLGAITQLHGDAKDRLFNDWTALRSRYDEGTFDVVVMCNVLHEIPTSQWGEFFGSDGKITRLLRNNGFLMLVEVQQLPYGELAHNNGFLVLDSAHLRKLFAISEADMEAFGIDQKRGGWLKAHLIQQPLLVRFSDATRKEALKDLSSTARDEIRRLRAEPPTYQNGRLHGFWVQQFANAQLALI